ncbi:unnamed protein product [Alternaria alternata]
MDYGPWGKPTTDTFELSTALAWLGLSQYEERLQENGFEDWETVTAITETDMAKMNFKRGHRRKLQRAICECSSASASHRVYEAENLPPPSEGLPAVKEHSEATPQPSQQAARTTRPYRRHPRPDPNAPRKPKTAYVLFSEHVRQDPALSRSSFTEIAKETGKRWRKLSHEERTTIWGTPAADRLQDYKNELERYKQTEEYRSHQTYLEGFKQRRHSPKSTTILDNKAASTSELASFGPITASEAPKEFEANRQESLDTDDADLEGGSQGTASPDEDGVEEVRQISKAIGINPHLIRVAAFPPEDMTTKAVEAFVHGTGSLLFLWNRDEAFDLVRSAYHPQDDSKPVHATEVFAISAVGSICDAEAHTMLTGEKFLHFFLYMLSSSSDVCALRRMRLFACLAICRFTNSVESARRLMLLALSMGRQAFTSPSFEADTSEEKVLYWRKVFRSIVFLERSARSTYPPGSF